MMCKIVMFIFFFKQKTSDEMRISDWSSDVCSSDLIERLLEKHQRVIVRNNPGNHDPHRAAMLSICLAARFHDNPRVTIDDSPSSFFYFRFGKTLIGSTHGDRAKLVDLPLIMACDVTEDWAASDYRVWHRGHFHHAPANDLVAFTVDSHRQLALPSAVQPHQ